MTNIRRSLPLLAVALLAGCGSSSPAKSTSGSSTAAAAAAPASAGAATGSVAISNFLYNPAKVTVKVGGSVTFTNKDSAPHTVTPDSGTPFADSGTLNQGQSKPITFTTPGTYPYHCAFHAFMHGTVTVTS